MGEIWNGIVDSLAWVLLQLHYLTNNAGLAIIVFTIAVKIVLLPIAIRQLRSAREMQKLQPKVKELRKKYGKDQQKLNEEMMKLYREHGVNPMGGCLPSLLQIPIFFGVYYAVLQLSQVPSLGALLGRWAGFATGHYLGLGSIPESILSGLDVGQLAYQSFLWMPSMGTPDPWHILPILAGVFQLLQQRMMTPREGDPQQAAMSSMMMFMPLMIVFIGWNFPAGPVLYWVSQSLFGIVQQYFTGGWGALTKWFPFLPERKPRLREPKPKPTPAAAEGGASQPRGWFWKFMDRMSALREEMATAEGRSDEGGEKSEDAPSSSLPPAPKKRRSRR